MRGLTAGFQGEGAKTVLPARASAKLSCRLVSGQDPDVVLDRIEGFLQQVAPPTCRVSFRRHARAHPVKLDLGGRPASWLTAALRRAYGAEPLAVFEGATIPVVDTFARALRIPPVPVGFGRIDDGAHGPDERFHVADLEKAILATAYLVEEAGGGPRP